MCINKCHLYRIRKVHGKGGEALPGGKLIQKKRTRSEQRGESQMPTTRTK